MILYSVLAETRSGERCQVEPWYAHESEAVSVRESLTKMLAHDASISYRVIAVDSDVLGCRLKGTAAQWFARWIAKAERQATIEAAVLLERELCEAKGLGLPDITED